MPTLSEISVAIVGQNEKYKRTLKESEQETEKFAGNVDRQLKKVESEVDNVNSGLSTSKSLLAGFLGGFAGGVLVEGIRLVGNLLGNVTDEVINGNARMETYANTIRGQLGGSADLAAQRMTYLKSVAADFGVEMSGLVKADEVLQAIGGSALATGADFMRVADAAAQANVPIEQMAKLVAKYFGDLQQGKNDSGALQQLREMGVVSSATVLKIDALVKAGGNVRQAWALVGKDLDRFKGTLESQGTSWDRMKIKFGEVAAEAERTIGAPFFDAAKQGLGAVIDFMNGPEFASAKVELTLMAEEAGKTLKEVGPKFLKEAGDGLIHFLKWVGSDDAKEAAATVKDLAVKVGELYVALKAIQGVQGIISIISMLRGGAPLIGSGGLASAAGLGGVGGAGSLGGMAAFALLMDQHGGEAVKRSRGTTFMPEFGGTRFDDPKGLTIQPTYNGPGAYTLAPKRDFAEQFRDVASGVKKVFGDARDEIKEFVTTAKLDLSSIHITFPPGEKPASKPKADPGSARFKGPKGPKGSKSHEGLPWMEGMLDEWVNDAYKAAEKNIQKFGDLMTSLERRIYATTGASEAQMVAWDAQKGSLRDLTDEQKKALIAKTDEADFMERSKRNRDQFAASRANEVRSLKEYARELNAEGAVADSLGKAENSRNLLSFSYWSHLTKARLDDIKARREGNIEIGKTIEKLQLELGLIKQSAVGDLMRELRDGAQKNADPISKAYSLWLAGQIDQKKQLDEIGGRASDTLAMNFQAVAEAVRSALNITRPYRDAMNDLSVRMALVGASTALARAEIEALSQGMNKSEAAEVARIQMLVTKAEEMRDLFGRAGDDMAQVMLDSFGKIGEGAGAMFDSLVGGFRQTLAKMAQEYLQSWFRQIIGNLIGGLFHGGGAGLIGGGHGSVSGPGDGVVHGSAAPSFGPGRMAQTVVNMHISTPDVGGFKRAQQQVTSEMVAGLKRAERRG